MSEPTTEELINRCLESIDKPWGGDGHVIADRLQSQADEVKELKAENVRNRIHDINNLRQYLVGIKVEAITIEQADESLVEMIEKAKR